MVLAEGDAEFEVQVHIPVPVNAATLPALDSLRRLPGGAYSPVITETFPEILIAPPKPPGFVGPAVAQPSMSGLVNVAGAPPWLYGQGPVMSVEGYPGVTQRRIVTKDRTPVGVITYGIDGEPGRVVAPGVALVKVSDDDPRYALFNRDGTRGALVGFWGWGDGSWEDFFSGVGHIADAFYPVPEVYHNITHWSDISTGEKITTAVDIVGMVPGGVLAKVLSKGGKWVLRIVKPTKKIDDVPPPVAAGPGSLGFPRDRGGISYKG